MREFGWTIVYTLSLSFPVFLELFGLIRRVRYDAAIDEFYLPYAAAKAGGRSAKRLFKGVGDVIAGEFVGRSSETQREMRKQRILSGTANGPIPPQNQPQKRKTRPEDRSAENQENGRDREI